jgi:hypothetical protein
MTMNTTETQLPSKPAVASSDGLGDRRALQFKIGDRLYWLGRSRDGNAWTIVANGDLVEHVSILHYGDVLAFVMVSERLKGIEDQWAARAVA